METTGNSIQLRSLHHAQQSFVATARGAENIAEATLNAVTELGSGEIAIGECPEEWGLIASGIVRGAIEFGANLEPVGKGMMLGAIRAVTAMGGVQSDKIKAVAELSLYETAVRGGDIGSMASGLECGAREGGAEVGSHEENCLSTAKEGEIGGGGCGADVLALVQKAIKRQPAAFSCPTE